MHVKQIKEYLIGISGGTMDSHNASLEAWKHPYERKEV